MYKENFLFITIDSLRFDTTQVANIPNFRSLFKTYTGDPNFIQVGAHGTYTLPAHIALFHDGRTPAKDKPELDGPYNRKKEILFRPELAWREKDATYKSPEAPNIVKGFEKMGYKTIGIGGVDWFCDQFETSAFWGKNYFQEFYWERKFSNTDYDGFENQIVLAKELLEKYKKEKLFFFINISSTHSPYMGNEASVKGQAKCLEYVDDNILRLINDFPKPARVIIMGDHGECFGEDGYYGHAIYHPKVMEVPMKTFIMNE